MERDDAVELFLARQPIFTKNMEDLPVYDSNKKALVDRNGTFADAFGLVLSYENFQ